MRARTTAAALAAVAALLGGAGAAGATADVTATRLAGTDRYATAAAVSGATRSQATVAIVASGENFPDALAASYLAGGLDAPVLLTPPTALADATRGELERLRATGVVLAGGPAAVSTEVEQALRDAGYQVDRVEGADRYATARRLARSLPATGIGSMPNRGRTAIVASGERFADALSGGPVAAWAGFPVLLTTPGGLHPEAHQGLQELEIRHVLLLGGTDAVSAATQASIVELGITVRRVFGDTRQGTAAALADLAVDELGWGGAHVNLARGDFWADALAGGPHGGAEAAPILLTSSASSLGTETAAWLSARQATVAAIHVLGGRAAVDDETVADARRAAGGT